MDEVTETMTASAAEEWLAIAPDLGNSGWRDGAPPGNARDWALVLEARGIPCRLERNGGVLQVMVPAACRAEAVKELVLFEEENRDWPPVPPAAPPFADNTLATLSNLLLLALFHNLVRLGVWLHGEAPPAWMAIGSADSELILNGQWWRLVTALTLHANSLHLLGNLAIGGIFIVYLCRCLGSGLGWALLLSAGVLGNLVNAVLQPLNHVSVGSSTLVFGAVGLLASLNSSRHRRLTWKRWFLPFAGAVALLALLGTEGERTDLGAHLCGFMAGAAMGLPAGYLVGVRGRPGRLPDTILSLLSAMVVTASWMMALAWGAP